MGKVDQDRGDRCHEERETGAARSQDKCDEHQENKGEADNPAAAREKEAEGRFVFMLAPPLHLIYFSFNH